MKTRILHVHDIPTTKCRVDARLKELDYWVTSIEAGNLDSVQRKVDIIVLDVPACRLKHWLHEANARFTLPLFWWCEERKPATAAPHDKVDGILCCGMNDNELQWSLLLGIKGFQRRLHLEREYSFLATKFEEKKLVDDAKIMLSKLKDVSETKAYEMMRTQAMNERKKLVEVAQAVLRTNSLITKNKSAPKHKQYDITP
ncbi:ANTAR domain-containing response regulator [Paenibacillus sp. OAS669]|uniref:ANTAR domain-containing response regulator n=1 Tax=Paenibacillus sp. OAS669 TaxID=2663821 RepID=UPI00178B792E|nr:ANTAR domain-containing protein [Paenibacillus sp. OAS669]MBE1445558.1 AmiR/NasT family two-component response regulator [Paenibacillus sp. OAS669]